MFFLSQMVSFWLGSFEQLVRLVRTFGYKNQKGLLSFELMSIYSIFLANYLSWYKSALWFGLFDWFVDLLIGYQHDVWLVDTWYVQRCVRTHVRTRISQTPLYIPRGACSVSTLCPRWKVGIFPTQVCMCARWGPGSEHGGGPWWQWCAFVKEKSSLAVPMVYHAASTRPTTSSILVGGS